MKAYIFRAALHCECCISATLEHLPAPAGYNPSNESTWDSDDYPKGPYDDGGGEADTPQHCDTCGAFLENPLTPDGLAYVREALAEREQSGRGSADVLATWSAFYVDALRKVA